MLVDSTGTIRGRGTPASSPAGGLSGHRWLHRAADHLRGRLHDGARSGARLEPVEECGEGRRRDRVRVAAVAEVVEDELHPPAAVLLRGGDVALDRREARPLLRVRRRPRRVGIERRDRLGEGLPVVDARDAAAAVIAAVAYDLLRARVERAERVCERRRLETVVEEVDAVVADLVPGGRRLQVLEVRVRQRVAGDLIPGGVEVAEL